MCAVLSLSFADLAREEQRHVVECRTLLVNGVLGVNDQKQCVTCSAGEEAWSLVVPRCDHLECCMFLKGVSHGGNGTCR